MNRNKLIILLVGFLDILSIGFVVPTLPDLAQYYWVSAHLISHGVTVYALFAFLAAPLLWQLSDIYGRKPVLTLCVIGSFLSSLLIALSGSYLFFLIWRILNGITWGNISILQSMMSDISATKEERRMNMGLIWMLFGIWFVVWPLVWGVLLHFGVMVPYWFMVAFSLVEAGILLVFMRETNQNMVPKKIRFNPFGQIWRHFRQPEASLFMASFFVLLVSFFLYQAILPLYLESEYGLSWSASGYVLAWMGVVFVLNQGFLLQKFWLKRFKLDTLLYIINFGLLSLFSMLAFVHSLPLFLFLFIFVASFQIVVNPVYQSEIIEHSELHARGEAIGVLSSLQAIAMFVGPLIGGILIDKGVPVFACSALFVLVSLGIVSRMRFR